MLDVSNIRLDPAPLKLMGTSLLIPQKHKHIHIQLLSLCTDRKFQTHFEHNTIWKNVKLEEVRFTFRMKNRQKNRRHGYKVG